MVSKDMAASLRFYRLLGLDIPIGVDGEDHVELITANGYRLASVSYTHLDVYKRQV